MDYANSPHAYQHQGLTLLKASHPKIRQLKRQGYAPEIHGNKVWRSSFVMMDYFQTYELPERAQVLDIGCGWGLLGMFLVKQFAAKVSSIDADANLEPYVQLHNQINGTDTAFRCQRFEQIRAPQLKGVHTVVGTDICFWDEMTTILLKLIARALNHGVEQVLIGDPGRDPFWQLAEACEGRFDTEVMARRVDRNEKHILKVSSG